MRVSDIKVQVVDQKALALVEPEALISFVEQLGYVGWSERRVGRERIVVGHDVRLDETRWVFLPAHSDYADYARRVSEALQELAEVSGRSELAVLLELLGVDEELPEIPASASKPASKAG